MNIEQQQNTAPENPLKQAASPLERVQMLGKETDTYLEEKTGSAAMHIQDSPLSPDKKREYGERLRSLRENYAKQAAHLRNIALVAFMCSATAPAFAVEIPSEEIAPISISQSVHSETPAPKEIGVAEIKKALS